MLPPADAMLRNRADSYGLIAIVLHWTIAAAFLGQVSLGLAMVRIQNLALQFTLIQWHKSLGFTILTLSLLRLAWRLANRGPDDAACLSRAEQIAAKAVHRLLYVLLILTPLAGWALVSTSTLDVPSLAFNMLLIPDLPLARSEAAETFWRQTHTVLAYATAAIAVGHILAALRHGFWLGDGLPGRMLGRTAAEINTGERRCRS